MSYNLTVCIHSGFVNGVFLTHFVLLHTNQIHVVQHNKIHVFDNQLCVVFICEFLRSILVCVSYLCVAIYLVYFTIKFIFATVKLIKFYENNSI